MTWTATTLHFVLVVVELIKKIRTELSSLKLPELREKGWDSSVGIVAKQRAEQPMNFILSLGWGKGINTSFSKTFRPVGTRQAVYYMCTGGSFPRSKAARP